MWKGGAAFQHIQGEQKGTAREGRRGRIYKGIQYELGMVALHGGYPFWGGGMHQGGGHRGPRPQESQGAVERGAGGRRGQRDVGGYRGQRDTQRVREFVDMCEGEEEVGVLPYFLHPFLPHVP